MMERFLRPVVNRIAPGFLRAFGLENGGKNPADLSPQLVPVIEARDWYLTQSMQRRSANGSAPVSANGSYPTAGTSMNVPADSWWLVFDWVVEVVGAAATTVTLQPVWSGFGPSTGACYPMEPFRVAANEGQYLVYQRQPFFLPPGSTCVLRATAFAGAGSLAWNTSAIVAELKI